MGQPVSFISLLRRLDDLESRLPQDIVRAVRALDVEANLISIAGAYLGNSVEAVERLVDWGCMPQLLTELERDSLASFLDSSIENLDSSIRKNKPDVAQFIGLIPPKADRVEALPVKSLAGYPLFPHQRRALRQIQQYIQKGRDRILLHMPTGGGKTRTAMNLVCETLRSREDAAVLWVASTKELLDQAAREFHKAWSYLGNREVPIIAAWEGRDWRVSDLNDGLFVASLATLHQYLRARGENELDALGARLQLIVFDEAHQAIASSYRDVVSRLSVSGQPITPIVGLTATPGRTYIGDEQDEALSDFFGQKKVTLDTSAEGGPSNPVDYLIENGYLARADFVLIGEAGEVGTDEDFLDYYKAVDKYLVLIAKSVRELIAEGHSRIIVFAASVELSYKVAVILRALGVYANALSGETEPAVRDTIIRQYKTKTKGPRVLINYGVLTTGFDAPDTSAAIIARSTNSLVLYSQMVGRAIRGPKAGGNSRAKVLTVVDPSVPAFGNIASAFAHWNEYWGK